MLYYAHRVVVSPRRRKTVARMIAATVNLRHGSISREAAAQTTVEQLEQDGIARLPDLLSGDDIAEIHDWLRSCPLAGGDAYGLDSVLNCPHVVRVMSDPRILAIAGEFLGCKPTVSSIGIRWSFCATRSRMVQTFHRDLDDWRFLKVFVYLTDVDDTSGPHTYVRGSHKTKGRRRAGAYPLEDLQRTYGPDAILRVVGNAGTSFVADTYGIHRGEIPVSSPRLILQIQYSVLPNFALLYEPVPVPAADSAIDPYTTRLLVERAGPAAGVTGAPVDRRAEEKCL